MTRTERRKNPDYCIAELEAQLALARENTQTNGQAYEDAMDRITELEAEKEQYDLNVVAWIQAEAELERLRQQKHGKQTVLAENTRLREDVGSLRLERDAALAKGLKDNEYLLARLHRIEEAARAYVEWANAIVPTEPFARLCAALKEEA